MTSEEKNAYQRLTDVFGEQLQYVIALEEMSELSKEICKLYRAIYVKRDVEKIAKIKENIAEEVADVLICAEQLELIIGPDAVEKIKRQKIERALGRAAEKEKEEK